MLSCAYWSQERPCFRHGGTAHGVKESDWARLIDQLGQGDCTPFLGAGACHGVLPTGAALSSQWAAQYGYPFADNGDLARVMEYAAASEGDEVYLKQKVCEALLAAGTPDFNNPYEPHALLAEFPIPVFLTTNYDDFLVKALQAAGKQPNSATCSWSSGMDVDYDRALFDTAPGLKPVATTPLVYYLHGSINKPRSMVLTENDYLEFLVKIASTRDSEELRLIPSAILSALTDNPLLFIGYSLQDWTFKVIFHGLLRNISGVHRRRHVSVQLLPPLKGKTAEAEERARSYLAQYFEENWRISIFWGKAEDFCREIRQRASSHP
jgi:SIR2-like domain